MCDAQDMTDCIYEMTVCVYVIDVYDCSEVRGVFTSHVTHGMQRKGEMVSMQVLNNSLKAPVVRC
jgi:hypothetical protein